MASEKEPIYCLCRKPYDETRFMIECDVCKDWFHGGCVGVQEHQAADIEIYHCPSCSLRHGPLVLKNRRNWHRHDYSEDGSKLNSAVQTGTVVFVKELKSRTFPSAEEIPIKRLHGAQLTPHFLNEEGFDVPILCEKKDGLGLTLPPPSISIQDIEQLVGPMREIDVIDVSRQDDIKMIMREWTEYYNSPNREKILNVISLEFSNTRLSELVVPPNIIRQVSWARNVWPEQLPEDSSLARPEVQKYCLMGVKDSFTDFHIDFGGTSVWYHVLRGEKVFYLIRPTQANLMLYESWLSSSNQSELFFGDQVDFCYKMVVKQGHTLFIPTGWIHAVLTPLDSLVFGGNFLSNYNIPLQLQCYEIERTVKTPEKYLFPSYETMNWYAAKNILDIMKDYTEEGKVPPQYLVGGARALSVSLKAWTQRKDLTSKFVYAQVNKRDAADYIQYGKLLKDLQKEMKKIDGMLKSSSPKKADHKRKKGEKQPKASKAVTGLDVLDLHTKETLKTVADREKREKIYNFEDEEEETPLSLKVRIPKAGAYVAAPEKKDAKPDHKTGKKENTLEKKAAGKKKGKEEVKEEVVKKGKGKVKEEIEEKPSVPKKETAKKGVKKKGKEKEEQVKEEEKVVKEEVVKNEGSLESSSIKEIPQCLKFKLSNGKMVSTDRKKKGKKMNKKEFVLLGDEVESPETPEKSPQKTPQKRKGSKEEEGAKTKSPKAESYKGKKQKVEEVKEKDVKGKKKKASESKTPEKDKLKTGGASKSKSTGKLKADGTEKSKQAEPEKLPVKSKLPSGGQKKKGKLKTSAKQAKTPALVDSSKDSDSDGDQLVVDENPKKSRVQKTTSTTKPASLKLKLPPGSLKTKSSEEGKEGETEAEMKSRLELETIRGGLNGSISDILTASGYGTETSFKVDNDSSGMRDAIAGMLTMSRMGDGEEETASLFSADGKNQSKSSAAEEEEQLMADCYRDSEFVYPSFELSDEEEESVFKSRKKSERDDNWNPKARVDPMFAKPDREHRVGAQKESLVSTLATTAAKLTENPPTDRKNMKKLSKPKVPEKKEFEVEPLPGPSSALDGPVNAFRPGIKRPVDPCASSFSSQPPKAKKPKKGLATAKQRLGKLLKIKKMVY